MLQRRATATARLLGAKVGRSSPIQRGNAPCRISSEEHPLSNGVRQFDGSLGGYAERTEVPIVLVGVA